MARIYKKSRKVIQRQYRARLAKYEKYKDSTLDPVSFKEWNAPYRQKQFLRKEFKHYQNLFEKRQKSAKYGFRLTKEGGEVKEYNFEQFEQRYYVTRTTLEEEVNMGERSKIGSVITEMVNDQAYELSRVKANAVANYLLREERPLLIQKGILKVEEDEEGKPIDIVKKRNLTLLVRQGQFVKEEVGLWDEIKEVYRWLTDEQGMTSKKAREEIGISYFESDPSKKNK